MSIHRRSTQRSGTSWVVRWRDPRPREKAFRTKLEAERFERTIRHQLDSGTYRDPGQDRVRFGEWAERWWHTVQASDRAANTKVQYESILRRHVLPAATTSGTEVFTPGLGDRRLVRLQRIDLEEWLAALSVAGRGASTIRTARTIAGMVLESAARSGVIRANPLLGVRMTRRAGSNARKALTPEQVEQLAEMIGDGRPGYRELVLLLGYGGLRPNEAFALRRRHFGDDGSVLVIEGLVEVCGHLVWTDGKTHRSRTVALPPSIVLRTYAHLYPEDRALAALALDAARPGGTPTPTTKTPPTAGS